jgi:hypothetical protein
MLPQEGEHGVQDFGGHAGGGVIVKIINSLLAHRYAEKIRDKTVARNLHPPAASSRKCSSVWQIE